MPMNVVLWILQLALALLSFAGGTYKLFSFNELAKMPATAALPRAGWSALGVFEIVCAILLVVPAATKWPVLTPIAATALAVEGVALAAIFARYSLTVAATNPFVWAVAMALMAAFIAYGRFKLRPTA